MNRNDIIRIAREAGFRVNTTEGLLEELGRFAALVIANHPPQSYMTWQEGHEAGKQAEREACIDLLMGLHEAQSNNGAHNYYHFAANAIKELRGKTITIKTKQFKCTGCQGKWHNSEDAKHHSCKDFQ